MLLGSLKIAKRSAYSFIAGLVFFCLLIPCGAGAQAAAGSGTPSGAQKSTDTVGAGAATGERSGKPSNAEIAAAKVSGKVWVNTGTGVYHKGGRWYGKTKAGKFMTEAEAKAAGYKAAARER